MRILDFIGGRNTWLSQRVYSMVLLPEREQDAEPRRAEARHPEDDVRSGPKPDHEFFRFDFPSHLGHACGEPVQKQEHEYNPPQAAVVGWP
jgi:hypothetical protein